MTDAPRLTLSEIALFERDVHLRMPFRYGAVTLTDCPQAFARVRIRLEDGRESWGAAAELLPPKWFDKDPALSNEDNFAQLRAALAIAVDRYAGAPPSTAFGLYANGYRAQIADGAARGLNPLVAGYGPALLDKAVLDALCRAAGVTFAQAIARNLPGIAVTDLTPDLDGFDIDGFLARLRPPPSIEARHTVGMLDPIASGGGTVGDGLPETLAEVIDAYGQRAFKLKVGGDIAADIARLRDIAAVLDRIDGDYRITFDGNEQYEDIAGVESLMEAIAAEPALARLAGSILFVEQPINRQVTLETDVSTFRSDTPLLIDEADGTLDSFPRAKALGYQGVSSKCCKGLYKSLLNAARCRHWNDMAGSERYFMSAEDLSTQAGLAVQQDLALVALIGIEHVERNGHHYANGISGASDAEQRAFLEAHPDLYHAADGVARLTVTGGRIALGSLDCIGFAAAATPDFDAMRPMPDPEWPNG